LESLDFSSEGNFIFSILFFGSLIIKIVKLPGLYMILMMLIGCLVLGKWMPSKRIVINVSPTVSIYKIKCDMIFFFGKKKHHYGLLPRVSHHLIFNPEM
jgi:hypothetical protein